MQEGEAAQGMEEEARSSSSDQDVGSISSGEDEDEDEEPGTDRAAGDEGEATHCIL